jgi:hypothetical protein
MESSNESISNFSCAMPILAECDKEEEDSDDDDVRLLSQNLRLWLKPSFFLEFICRDLNIDSLPHRSFLMISRQEDDMSVVFPAATAIIPKDDNPNAPPRQGRVRAEGFSDRDDHSSKLYSSDQNGIGILKNAEGDKRQDAAAIQPNKHPFNGYHSQEGIK